MAQVSRRLLHLSKTYGMARRDRKASPVSAAGNVHPYKILNLEGRGQGLITTRSLAADEEIFKEPMFLSVKTIMILSGVIVLRRSKVEKMYERLGPAQKLLYCTLHPLCYGRASGAQHGQEAPVDSLDSRGSLRQRAAAVASSSCEEAVSPEAGDEERVNPPTSSQHRLIWDTNAFHYCDDQDVYLNRVLHLAICPSILSIVVGSAWAYCFEGSYIRSILGACVLFFTMLGPLSARMMYFGSQALFLQGARANHSCMPNVTWHISGQKAPLGGPVVGDIASEGKHAEAEIPATLFFRAKRKIEKETELTIDYIPDLPNLDALGRRSLLQQEYDFICACPKCQAATARQEETARQSAQAGNEEEEE